MPIPQGAQIVEAHIRFTVDGPYSDTMTVRFRGEASGNAATFDDTSRPDTRPLIPDVMADWEITAADPWTLGESRDSPPLAAIVQAIVDRADWSSGNALAIITQNVGTATGTWRHRRVIGYDRPVWYPGTEYAARLVVTYSHPVSPPTPPPDWSTFGGQAGAWLGYSAATAGDVNGDGYADVIVGAHLYDGSQIDAGRVLVYHGSANGLGATPAWTADGEQAGDELGFSVATAGDVNGDGYADVIVGAHGSASGSASVYLGSASGLEAAPVWTAHGSQPGAGFGGSVATAGDVNGDAYADIVVGAPEQDAGPGHAYLFLGGPDGPAAAPAWTGTSGQHGSRYGVAVASAGELNADGYADLAVGADRYSNGEVWEGAVYLYHGTAAGLDPTATRTIEGTGPYGRLGYSVGTAGDVNGDGYADLIVGIPVPPYPSYAGQARVYLRSSSGLPDAPAWVVDGDQDQGEFGARVGAAGDVDGDGYGDVVVAAYRYNHGQAGEGRISIYRGSASGLVTASPWIAESNQANAYLGVGLGAAGDVDGDGYADVIAGAYSYDDDQTDEGAAFVYHGGPGLPGTTPDWTVEADQDGAELGYSMGTAGDVNGDGYADVIMGAPAYDAGSGNEGAALVTLGSPTGLSPSHQWMATGNEPGAHFGYSVGTAGDVNGDGYDDIIVGSYYAGGSGQASVYYGSAGGVSPAPAWVQGLPQAAARFGAAVGTAGDVNGDGYADVIVGAYLYDGGEPDEGAAFVYYGSASGLDTQPGWSVEGNQANAYLGGYGRSVGAAGDVNGDGYGDVIVGAFRYSGTIDRQGQARVYYGGPAGLSTTPAWSTVGETGQAYLGFAVGTAGDVNGDGYSDVIVGSHGYGGGSGWAQGAVYVFLGSAQGLQTPASWRVVGDQAEDYLGVAVGTAGDVDGDGYADVIVGAPRYDNGQDNEGRAYLYKGTPSGPSGSPIWTVESNQQGAWLGYSAASAGDVNGDGYADLGASAMLFDGDQTDEGAALVYYGNQGGLGSRPQQRRSDGSTPIALLGKSDEPDSFRLALLGRTPFGRGKVKLEWEVKPRGVLFDGAALQRSADWIDTGTAGAQLDEVVAGLQQDTLYHWRVRLLYHPAATPFQQTSRWITNPWNGWNEARLRTAGPPTTVRLVTLEAAAEPSAGQADRIVVVLIGLALSAGAALLFASRPGQARRRVPPEGDFS